jgi:hypothetical protein
MCVIVMLVCVCVCVREREKGTQSEIKANQILLKFTTIRVTLTLKTIYTKTPQHPHTSTLPQRKFIHALLSMLP